MAVNGWAGLRNLEFRAPPDDLEPFKFVDGVVNAFLFDAMPESAILSHQLKMQLLPVLHRQIDLRGMFALSTSFLGGDFDSLNHVHGSILPSQMGCYARVFLWRLPRNVRKTKAGWSPITLSSGAGNA